MVFESVVVDVLNRFLGDYVVNLDTSQLTLGIWGGAVALKNLEIKENALSQLDVPFKVKVGHIGNLNLIIPWKNLYTQPVEAVLGDIYLLIVPSSKIKYDPLKEEKQLLEAKQHELKRIEEAKQKVADQEKLRVEKQDTFTEKLITQIIKNLQVKISNIHIRYEDDITNRDNPLSFGISLQNLSMQTTDQNWVPCLHDETEKLFCKLIRLDNLFAYWNVKSQLFYLNDYDESLDSLKKGIVNGNIVPKGYDFVFRPISANAKLQMNRRSDFDFSAPKINLDVELHDIAIELNKPQYFSVMELLESVDMMTQNLPYRKFKPDVPLHYHARDWWAYAIHSVLEVNVCPRLRMWSWKHIREHRQKMKQYKELYKKKITTKKPTGEILMSLEELEKTLDVFNITISRQQAEVEVKKAGYRIFREGAKDSEENKGWFSWLWTWSEPRSKEQPDVKPGILEEMLTSEEKTLLYEAIGYSETAVDPTLPKTFEAMKFFVHLKSMSIVLREKQETPELLDIVVEEFSTLIVQRPGAQAIKFETKIDSFHVTGLPDNSTKPRLLSSLDDATSLFQIIFEINPLDETVAQRCIIEAEPLEMIYDARTVNSIVEFFRPPKEVNLAQLTSATLTKLEEFRDKTATGLLYIIETQKVLDLKINLKASYVIIPQGGIFSPTSNLLLLDLGHLKVTSKSRSELPDMKPGGARLEEIMHRAYDSFDVQLTSIQLLYSTVGDDWREARKLNVSTQHILVPMHFNVELSKAMVFMDIRMPKFKIFGKLPLISLRISDKKLQGILELIESIPKPTPATETYAPAKPFQIQRSTSLGTSQISQKMLPFLELPCVDDDSEEEFFDAPCSPLDEPLQSPTEIQSYQKKFQKLDCSKNMIQYKIRFEVPEVLIQFYHLVGDSELPVVEVDVLGLGTDVELRTFDLKANAFLKEFCLKCPEHFDANKKPIYLITTLDNTMEDLLTLEYVKAEKNLPNLKSTYNNAVQLIKVNFSSLDIHLHTEALLNTINYFNNIIPQLEEKPAPVSVAETEDKGEVVKKMPLKLSKNEDIITLQILAELSCLQIFIQDQKRNIAEIKIEGLDSEIIMRPAATEINAKLRNIIVLDSDKTAVYKKAVYITGKEVFSFKMISFVDATAGSAYTDMNVVDVQINLTVGCIEVVFITKFLYSILAFIDNFQAAKQALAEATVQAAGMAATGVKELAQRSSRMALDVNIKAPVVVIPQSPVSENVFVADFGLITMTNTFHVITESQSNPPPVIDLITIRLSEMRLYRTQFIDDAYQEVLDLLLPLNLEVIVERNLSWEWYQEVPCFNVNAQLKPMELILSQEDITTIFKTLYSNIWYEEGGGASPAGLKDQNSVNSGATNASHHLEGTTVVTAAVVEIHSQASQVKTTLNMSFRTDYLTMVLYSPGPEQTSFTDVRDPSLKLAEFKLENIISTAKMYTDDSTFSSFSLKNCILDDKRPHVKKATPRMIGLTVGFDKKDMMDVKYRRVRDGWVTDLVLQETYICASVEFLLTVANVFLEAYTTGTAVETSVQTWTAKEEVSVQESEKWEINIIIKNPEIVFVADMTRSDAPALVITTQCEICWKGDLENNTMTAAIKDLQVRACPFLPVKRKGKITTVLQPCDLFYQATQIGTDPQVIDVSIKSLTLKVSPVIINTVITITSALYTSKDTIPQETTSSTVHLWEKKDTKNLKMWFLEEPNEVENKAPTTELILKGEMIRVNIDSIFIVLEAGIGHRTVPMLLAKSRFSGEGKNWSSLINLYCQLDLEVHYYNEMFGVWEPLLEPLEIDQTEDFRPWNLGIKMKKKAKKAIVESDTEEENYKVPEYKTVISFHSKDQLNITLSKCGLVMLNNLVKAFTEAATGASTVFIRDLAPFMILNSLGLTVSVSPSDSFSVLNVPLAKSYVLKNEESLSMDYVGTKDNDHFSAMTSLSSKLFFILLTPASHSTADKIPLTKVGRRLYTVRHRASGVERSIVCQVDGVEGSKKITIRSPVQIKNHFSIPLCVYEGNTLLGTASPGSEFNIPLTSYRSPLSLKPEDEDYQTCERIDFEEIIKNDGTFLKKKCRSKNTAKKPFIIHVVPEKDNLASLSVYSEDGWDLPYIMHLWPPILLRNLLPYKIAYYIEGIEHKVYTLNEGHSAHICTVHLEKARLHLKLLDYLNHDWKSEYHIKPNQQDISFINFTCVTEIEKTDLDIAIHVTYNIGQTVVAFHSPYWMVNKTSRMLQYKADGIHRKHPPNYKKPVLFSFQPKHFFNNNKVQLMVTDSELSDQFSIDTVGSHGAVKCKGLQMDYQVGVTIDLSSFNITRIVTFTPFYMIENKSKYHISVAEQGNDKWLSLDLEQCIPFWPEDASNALLIQVERNQGPPKKIHFNKQASCILLRLDNELGGIIAEVNLAEHSTVITFSDYHDGAAPFLLINHTKSDIVQYNQSSLSEIEDSLPPGKAVFYTWADPVGSRKLKWRCGKSHGEVAQKDDMMTPINSGKKTIYLVSFFEGLQRIILFTEDPRVFKATYESEKAELAEQEIVLALQDVGISLVNNYTKQEVAYIGITSSDVVWETKPKKKARWKPMSVKHTEKLEKEFKEYTESSPSEDKVIELDTNIPVRFTPSGTNMKILQPHVIAIRRNYLPALKVEYSTSAHQSSFRIQVYRIQIQNQIHGAIFPFVFYPIKPPKSVTMDSAPKPFTDVSIVMRSAGHSQISRIKYFKVLIQEMDLRLDLGFVYALAELMTEAEVTEKTEIELFHKDIEAFQEEYKTASLADSSQVSLYEYFHISPIKLHLSVSLSSGKEAKDSEQQEGLMAVRSLNLLLKSIGATLTDVQDVVFKLAFFELNYQFHTASELQSEVIRHYSKQAIKQMYVLILGLEVLGNPFGLIREFSEGVEAFFYEPYQGAIQGPEEFVEGMALGLKALVGGAVGGLAGAASKITNAMAKGVAAMTLDEDYQQKRREAMNKQPAGLREGITRGGKGLVSGFVSGITGIVTKPIKGAQKEGAAGFFKGVGKGLVGAVARPTGGIIDMASSTFQGIKRATETSDEVESLRPPRFFNEDGVIRPYRLRDGTGNQMLQVMENGRFAKYKYFTHVMINKTDMLMITKSGVLFVTKGTFGQLTCEWQYSFDEFTKEPFIVHGRRLRIEAKERVKSVFHAKEFGKIINFKTPEDARWILTKLEEAREPSPRF
ncbi:intermembrane lipid transfer protein VPS13A isoform X1 [Callorhinus ursinus]|uniref:Vacuolar protein sorting-associated protein 13A isoform X1 n=1 Tax=Callorhinus ursinus TaxID=34884 RepID=A0A3Q7QL07_CALUR|nr:vacuolar protein sorting-associated protein 13A isoform X1 [Callorhinus ursinus]XP_025747360.1 vacuolar protein sorting-associated protein 13A isoform X1 [Callorhinus ursinus]